MNNIKRTIYAYMCQQPQGTTFTPATLNHAVKGFTIPELKQALISLWLDGILTYRHPSYKVRKCEK